MKSSQDHIPLLAVKCYFSTESRIALLVAELLAWEGTPYVAHMAKRGLGADCLRFAVAVLQDLGVVGVVEWPRYSLRGGGPEVCEMLCERILASGVMCEVIDELPGMPGDLLVFTTGKAMHHVGIRLDGPWFYHCLGGYGVIKASLGDSTFGSRLHRVYRPMEVLP